MLSGETTKSVDHSIEQFTCDQVKATGYADKKE